jgi:hypothetical protein
MFKQKRDAIIALLPDGTFIDESRGKDHIDVTWTTKDGKFSLVTAPWDNHTSWNTRVIITALHCGENVTLRTEDAGRIREAIALIGGIST